MVQYDGDHNGDYYQYSDVIDSAFADADHTHDEMTVDSYNKRNHPDWIAHMQS